MSSTDAKTNRLLKEGVNVKEIFCIYLAQLIFSETEMHSPKIWSYDPVQLDAVTQSELSAKVKQALSSPQSTSAYRYITSGGDPESNDRDALRYVELAGLIVLILLGEKQLIPVLLKFMRENQDSVRARTIVSGVLLYLTGQDIGSFFLTEEDLDLWEEWWEQNKDTFLTSRQP